MHLVSFAREIFFEFLRRLLKILIRKSCSFRLSLRFEEYRRGASVSFSIIHHRQAVFKFSTVPIDSMLLKLTFFLGFGIKFVFFQSSKFSKYLSSQYQSRYRLNNRRLRMKNAINRICSYFGAKKNFQIRYLFNHFECLRNITKTRIITIFVSYKTSRV